MAPGRQHPGHAPRVGSRVPGTGRGRAQLPSSEVAGSPGRAHSPSRALFFLARVPPSLPRKDSSFFILAARGVGERGGAEDMGGGVAGR